MLFQRLRFYAGRGVIRALRMVFEWMYIQSYLLENQMTEQNNCKHEGSEGKKYCANCGKKVDDELDALANKLLEKIKPELEKIAKPAAPNTAPKKARSVLDRVLNRVEEE